MSDTAVGIDAVIRLKREKLQQDIAGATGDIQKFANMLKTIMPNGGVGMGSAGGMGTGTGAGSVMTPQTTQQLTAMVQKAISGAMQQIQGVMADAVKSATVNNTMNVVNAPLGAGAGEGVAAGQAAGGRGLLGDFSLGRFARYGTAYFGAQTALGLARANAAFSADTAMAGRNQGLQAQAILKARERMFGAVPVVGGLLSEISDPMGRGAFGVQATLDRAEAQSQVSSMATGSRLETDSLTRQGGIAGASTYERQAFAIQETKRQAMNAARQNSEMESNKVGDSFGLQRSLLDKQRDDESGWRGSKDQLKSLDQQQVGLSQEEIRVRKAIAEEYQKRLKAAEQVAAGEEKILKAQIEMEHAAVAARGRELRLDLADNPIAAAREATRSEIEHTRKAMNLKESGSGNAWFNTVGRAEMGIQDRDQGRRESLLYGGMASRASALQAEYRGDVDSAGRQRLELQQKERRASLLATSGQGAVNAYDAPGGEADMERKRSEQDIQRRRTLEAAQSGAAVLRIGQGGENAMDRAGGNVIGTNRRELEQSIEAQVKALKDEAAASKDAVHAKQLLTQATAENLAGARKLAAFDVERAHQIAVFIRESGQSAQGFRLQSTGQNTTAGDRSFANGYENRIADLRRENKMDEAKSLQVEYDAAKQARGYDKEKTARSIRLDTIRANAGYLHKEGLSDAENLRASIMDDQRDTVGDPRRRAAANQLGVAELREMQRGLTPIGRTGRAGDYDREFQDQLDMGNTHADALSKIAETLKVLEKGKDLQDDTKDTNSKLKGAADSLAAATANFTRVKVIGR